MKRYLARSLAAGAMLVASIPFHWLPGLRGLLVRLFRPRLAGVRSAFAKLSAPELARTILFLSPEPHSREVRMMAAATAAGWHPFLIHTGRMKTSLPDNRHSVLTVRGLFDLLLASWIFPGTLVHVFGRGGPQIFPFVATKARLTIVDIYDTVSGFTQSPGLWSYCERLAIRRADGATHRDLRIKHLQRMHDYQLPRHNLLIHDPLPPEVRAAPVRRNESEIRVVSSGWVGRGDNSVLRTTQALCRDKIHVHLYVNPFQDSTDPEVAEYLKLARESAYFHLEQPVYGAVYREHLNRYDFGLAIFEPFIFGESPLTYTTDYLQGCGSSRCIDYIEANLGVIVTPGLRFMSFWARRYASVFVPATREFLANPRPVLEAALLARQTNPPKNLSAITTTGVAARLGEFYTRVAAHPLEASRPNASAPA